MKTFIWTALFIHVFSFYSFAEQLNLPLVFRGLQEEDYMIPTQPGDQDSKIGIKYYSDPSVYPMIGWRGMIIKVDDKRSDYFLQISTNRDELDQPPFPDDETFSPSQDHSASEQPSEDRWTYQNRWMEGKNDENHMVFL